LAQALFAANLPAGRDYQAHDDKSLDNRMVEPHAATPSFSRRTAL